MTFPTSTYILKNFPRKRYEQEFTLNITSETISSHWTNEGCLGIASSFGLTTSAQWAANGWTTTVISISDEVNLSGRVRRLLYALRPKHTTARKTIDSHFSCPFSQAFHHVDNAVERLVTGWPVCICTVPFEFDFLLLLWCYRCCCRCYLAIRILHPAVRWNAMSIQWQWRW